MAYARTCVLLWFHWNEELKLCRQNVRSVNFFWYQVPAIIIIIIISMKLVLFLLMRTMLCSLVRTYAYKGLIVHYGCTASSYPLLAGRKKKLFCKCRNCRCIVCRFSIMIKRSTEADTKRVGSPRGLWRAISSFYLISAPQFVWKNYIIQGIVAFFQYSVTKLTEWSTN